MIRVFRIRALLRLCHRRGLVPGGVYNLVVFGIRVVRRPENDVTWSADYPDGAERERGEIWNRNRTNYDPEV